MELVRYLKSCVDMRHMNMPAKIWVFKLACSNWGQCKLVTTGFHAQTLPDFATCRLCVNFAILLCDQVCANFASDRKVAKCCDMEFFIAKSQNT